MRVATAPSIPLAVGWARDIVRRWGWRTSALATSIGAATLFSNGTPFAFAPANAREGLVAWLFNVLQFGFPLVFAVQVADRAVDHGISALRAYSIAVIVTSQVGVWIVPRLLWPLLGKVAWWGLDNDVMLIGGSLSFHGLCVGAYAQWRGERVALERLQAAERSRAIAQRQVVTSRLLALQARVDPQLLFEALGGIDAALAGDGELAERRLANLIGLLRAMQPGSFQRASTLAREMALIAAHARVSGAPGLQPALLNVDATDAALRASVAPLVLLPLMRWLATLNPSGWRVEAVVIGARLAIDITAMDASAAVPPAATPEMSVLDEMRQRLVAVHGPSAELRVDPDISRLSIEVGADHDAHPDRRG